MLSRGLAAGADRGGGAVSYERGTPVQAVSYERGTPVQVLVGKARDRAARAGFDSKVCPPPCTLHPEPCTLHPEP